MDNILKDKRFSHVVSNPRFKNIPRNERKVKIDKRFQAMFTDKRFQVKFKVDERGREINELQSDNYKKYYELTDSSSDSDEEDKKVEDSEEESETEDKKVEDSEEESEIEVKEVADSEEEPDVEDKVVADSGENGEESSGEEFESELKQISPPKSKKKKSVSDKVEEDNEIVNNESASVEPDKLDKIEAKNRVKEKLKEVNKFVDEVHKTNKLSEKVKEKLSDFTVDYARGIGTLLSASESSSDESSSDESDGEAIEHAWGEFDKDAEETEEISPRLAVCNMDWDRVTAKDLMVLFHSFLPSDGVIKSVTIYPSEFGLARMAEEELHGPKELVENDHEIDVPSDEEIEEGSSYQREKLREYQLKRLKYYYAVLVFNSAGTANMIYTECNGLEYESSATKLDLRFISDDITFDQKPHDTCTSIPDLKKYRPRSFINTALQQGKVDLTWDETDPNRIDFTRKMLSGEDVGADEVNAYLASSSGEEEVEEEEESNNKPDPESDDDGKGVQNDKDRIMAYRSLISNLQEMEDRKKGDVEMEVTWGADAERKVNNSSDDSDAKSGPESDDEGINKSSDDESLKPQKKFKKKGSKRNQKVSKEINSDDEKDNAELELLLAEDNPDEMDRKHFNLEAIQKQEKQSSKRKKWRKKLKKDQYQEEDTFKIDTNDSRFSALYTSHHFNIDPANPHYRKTKAMTQLISEKQKRRKLDKSWV